ncbi:hypothetical protein L596_028853 [Steinernema carpocapsae]|uniref:Uncharacterized protein n=1 Tax=Steinernema carpocapsae TaxID=34508 RepID=A0A4U5LZQ3_STECR|nr:hypothetical protein L596_028853 [Steinernema carpocapsae]
MKAIVNDRSFDGAFWENLAVLSSETLGELCVVYRIIFAAQLKHSIERRLNRLQRNRFANKDASVEGDVLKRTKPPSDCQASF